MHDEGLISGVIASLIAPWVHWGIEKKKLSFAARRTLISSLRHFLESPPGVEQFRESVIYSQLRPFLRQGTVEMTESDVVMVQLEGRGSGANNY